MLRSVCANCAIFAHFKLILCTIARERRVIGSIQQKYVLCFKALLSFIVQFSHNYLCFQVHLSFVPRVVIQPHFFSITYWLRSYVFCIFPISPFLTNRDSPELRIPSQPPNASVRQTVHRTTTIIGYHSRPRLSSGNCAKAAPTCRIFPPCPE